MSIIDKIFGNEEPRPSQTNLKQPPTTGQTSDEQAIARYRYLLQTAPPETIEQAHAEAFARLTPEQRQMVLQQLQQVVPEGERGAVQNDPQALARAATRAEVRQPGTMERTFGGMGGGIGFGGMMASSFLGSIAGVVVGSAIAQSFFGDAGFGGGEGSGGQEAADANQDSGATGGDSAAADAGGDLGGGFDDFGGDF